MLAKKAFTKPALQRDINNKNNAQATAEYYDEATIKKWLTTFFKRFFTQQFKRSCLPDGPKVCSVSLSPRGDWRMPTDAIGRLWIEECEAL